MRFTLTFKQVTGSYANARNAVIIAGRLTENKKKMQYNNFHRKDTNISKLFKTSVDNSTQYDDNNNHIKSSEAIVWTLPTNSIKIKEEYARLVPDISQSDYESLKSSIKENGLIVPIIINKQGIILDGHHRYKACHELRITLQLQEKHFDDSDYEALFVIQVNLKRRHLTDAQKIELGHTLKPIYARIAKKNESIAGRLYGFRKNNNTNNKNVSDDSNRGCSGEPPLLPLGSVNQAVAKEVNISRSTFQRGEKVLNESPEIWKQVVDGKLTVNEGYNTYKKQQRRRELEEATPVIDLPEGIQLFNADFVDYANDKIPTNSIDLIFTDPPYGEESIPYYVNLARTAIHILKNGGSLVTFAGQFTLPTVMRALEAAGLKYYWILAVKHSGASQAQHARNILCNWKPMLWYVKGEKSSALEYIDDHIISQPPDKAAHEMAQSPVEAEHVIKRLTVENQVILDPFMGSGSTGIAALKLGRKFIGIEIDEKRFGVAKSRMVKKQQQLLMNKEVEVSKYDYNRCYCQQLPYKNSISHSNYIHKILQSI